MPSNLAAGSLFERQMAKMLADDGFWALVVPRNAGGQQPADILAVKGKYHVLIDCKVVSGDRFPFDRVEDNQHYAMGKFFEIGGEVGWFALLLPDGEVRMLDLETVELLEDDDKKSLSVKDLKDSYYTRSFQDWRERVNDLCE